MKGKRNKPVVSTAKSYTQTMLDKHVAAAKAEAGVKDEEDT